MFAENHVDLNDAATGTFNPAGQRERGPVKATGLTGPLPATDHVSRRGIEGAAATDTPTLPEPIPVPDQPYRLQ